jgi:hypothetical protein
LGCDWPQELAIREKGSSGTVRERGGANTAIHAPVSVGEHAPGKAEISSQESIVVAKFHGQAVLQRGILARTSPDIERPFLAYRDCDSIFRARPVRFMLDKGFRSAYMFF